MSDSDLVFVPLGGVGEIGMNLALYGYGPAKKRQWIMVDCGVTFPGPDLPGVDLVLPDIQFAVSLGDSLKGIVITHSHEDHYGALLALWPKLLKPVWCTPFTAGMLESKATSEQNAPKIPVNIFKAGERFNVGPFELEALHVTHSIPEPVSLLISTPLGKLIHTGDWKIDAEPSLGADTDEKAFRRAGDAGVLALICDSTNAMRTGKSPTEQAVSDSLADIITNASGRVAITTFSSNVGRIRSIAHAAQKAGRKVMLMGRSIRRVSEVADEIGYLEGLDEFIDEDEFQSLDRKKVVIILTGSQGEDRAALAKLARDEHPRVHLGAGDTVVYSSRTIPGNEKAILETKNRLIDLGVDIITDDDALVHVSGHPRQDELEQMYGWVRPQISVPVHGEAAHLSAHAALAAGFGVPQVAPVRNGHMLRLAPGPAEIIGEVPHGRIYKDGSVIGNDEDVGVRERRRLSFAGLVAVSIVLDQKGRLADDVDLSVHGLPARVPTGEAFDDILFDVASQAIDSLPVARRRDDETIMNSIEKAVRAAARDHWGKKPMVTVFVARV
ncbi:MAG: ribonuclease J [Rhizobiaceae bacterium]